MSRTVHGVALLALLAARVVLGATWVVCPVDCPYATVAEAVAAAAAGDTILVRSGTYVGDLWLRKGLDLRSEGDEPSVIEGRVYVLGAGQVTLHGLTIRGGGLQLEDSSSVLVSDCIVEGPGGIIVRSSSAHLCNTVVRGADAHGVLVTLGSRVLLTGCTVIGSRQDGIHIAASMADLRDNEVHDSGGYGIWADGSATVAGQATLAALSGNAGGTLGGAARVLDRDPPAAPVEVAVSPAGWTAGPIAVSWTAPADLSGIAAAWYTIGSVPTGPDDGVRTTGNPFIVTSPPEGHQTLHVWLEDRAGNRDERARAEITFLADRTPPTGEVSINGGARHVFSTEVSVRIEAEDRAGEGPGSGVAAVRLSNDGKTWSPWQPFAATQSWDLARTGGSSAPGAKTVFVEIRDEAGNVGRISTRVVLVQSVASPEAVLCLAFTTSGNRLAQGFPGGAIRLVDPLTGQEVRVLQGHTGGVYAVAFSPDGRILASGSNDNTVRLWDLAGTRDPRVLRGHTGGVWSVAYAPDGKTIASGASDGSVRLWDVATGRSLRTLTGHAGSVRSVAFSPDGKLVASGGDDRSVNVWDVSTGRAKYTLTEHGAAVRSVAFSPDGKLLASVGLDGKVLLWDVASGKLARTLATRTVGLRAVAFAPDGRSVAAATATGVVVVWDLATAKEQEVFEGHTAQINALVYAPDGRTLASGGADKVVRLWDVGP